MSLSPLFVGPSDSLNIGAPEKETTFYFKFL